MKVKNTTKNVYRLKSKTAVMLISPYETADIPAAFQNDPTLRMGIASGDLQRLDPEPIPETFTPPVVEEEKPEETTKSTKKRSGSSVSDS